MKEKTVEQNLVEAVRWGHRIEVLLAIKGGASVHTKDEIGNDIVLLAAGLNHWTIVDDLLICGANVEAQTIRGCNRLIHYAAANGEWAATCGLIRFKALLNVANKYGDTPLDLAVRNNHYRVIDLLRQNHARATSEMHHIGDVLRKLLKDYTIEHFGEEYVCLCNHGLRHHTSGGCDGIVRSVKGDEELCSCDMFADIWGREVPKDQFDYSHIAADYDSELL
jgi:Ankyrin repeat.